MDAANIFKKLRLDSSKRMLIVNAPEEYKKILSEMQYDREYRPENSNSYDFVQIFAVSQSELEEILRKIAAAGKYDCLFWICYPKGTGKIKSDLKRDKMWDAFSLVSLRPVTQIAIDKTWSALRGRPDELVGK